MIEKKECKWCGCTKEYYNNHSMKQHCMSCNRMKEVEEQNEH